MDFFWQSDVSAFKNAVKVCRSFSSKKQVSFNFVAAVTVCSDFGPQEDKNLSLYPLFLHLFAMKWWNWIPWTSFLWMLSFKPAYSLSSFTLIKRLFSSSSLSAINVVLSAYLRLLFLLAILIPACASGGPIFHMMYSCGSAGKKICLPCGRPGLGRSPGGGTATHSRILEWRTPWTVVHGVAKSWT